MLYVAVLLKANCVLVQGCSTAYRRLDEEYLSAYDVSILAGKESGNALGKPFGVRNAIGIGESKDTGRCGADAGIPCCIRPGCLATDHLDGERVVLGWGERGT
jgi:hypothetical protein